MTDPVTRAARRQTLLDRLAEQLTLWGCPPDLAESRGLALLHVAEAHGWALPSVDAPPIRGGGSTDVGRARARVLAFHTRAGCRCEPDSARALPPDEHPLGCPVRGPGGSTAPGRAADPASDPLDKIDSPPGVLVPDTGLRHSDETPGGAS